MDILSTTLYLFVLFVLATGWLLCGIQIIHQVDMMCSHARAKNIGKLSIQICALFLVLSFTTALLADLIIHFFQQLKINSPSF